MCEFKNLETISEVFLTNEKIWEVHSGHLSKREPRTCGSLTSASKQTNVAEVPVVSGPPYFRII
jgi:hypothetical protein